jgi:2-keto-4-pentenoate hydratase
LFLKPLRVPIGFLKAPFAGVFEKFIHRQEHYAGPFHIQPQIEVEFVVEKMNVAVAQHTEERATGLEIVSVNNAVSDSEFGVCFVSDAVSAAGHDVI